MNGRHRPFVAGVHRLEHVQCFARPDFANDDPIRPHTQTVLHQVALRHLTFAFNVRRTRFKPDHVGLLQLQLRCILNGDDALVYGNVA